MHILDWLIVVAVFAILGYIAYSTKRHVRSIADYLAANRCAGRYMLTLADGMAGLGAIGIIGAFQQNYQVGLGAAWWGGMMAPVMLLLPLSGFIIYRFRESRVLTIAEFFERRYSRNFRIFAGIVAWVAGVINYGVFPSVTARFLIYFCGLPQYTFNIGGLKIDVTLGAVMFVLLATALFIIFRGGQIAIMVTDFLQAQYMNIVFIILLVVLVIQFGLGDFIATLKSAPEGQSLINPIAQGDIPDFNVFFFVIMAFNAVYTYMAWQGNQGYNCAARTPHEAKMARILAAWRYGATWTVILLIPVFCYVVLNGTAWPELATKANGAITSLGDEGLQRQLTVPLALREILPVGVFGLFVAAMIAAAVSTDDTYLHSWGSIFIQDVLMPFRKKPMDTEQHMRWLRRSSLGVAIFVWAFGMLFPLYDYIFMYWAITGAIYVGGAGSVIIGGFYWRRATTAGAWAGMLTGSLLSVTGVILINIVWPSFLPGWKVSHPDLTWLQALPEAFWLNGMECAFYASLAAVFAYVGVSLVTRPDPNFSLERLLHRGEFAIDGEHETKTETNHGLWRILGVDSEYTMSDKLVVLSIFAWTLFWFVVFVVGTIYGLNNTTTDEGWVIYWYFHVGAYVLAGVITMVWFLWGGFKDLSALFRALNEARRDTEDTGFIADSHEKPITKE